MVLWDRNDPKLKLFGSPLSCIYGLIERAKSVNMEQEASLEQHLQSSEAHFRNNEYNNLLQSLNAIFHHLTITEKAYVVK